MSVPGHPAAPPRPGPRGDRQKRGEWAIKGAAVVPYFRDRWNTWRCDVRTTSRQSIGTREKYGSPSKSYNGRCNSPNGSASPPCRLRRSR